jgi:hypothetical protein
MSTGQRRLQVALSHLLTDDLMRAALRNRPAEVRNRYCLTSDEFRLLVSLDSARLELTAHAGEGKRLDFLRRGMPMTVGAVERAHRAELLFDHVRASWAADGPVLTSRILRECRQFVVHLEGADLTGLPAWIRDIAQFELAAAELAASVEASADAERAQRETVHSGPVVLGRHVRVLSFAWDIVSLRTGAASGNPKPVAATSSHLALVKSKAQPPLQGYRIGEQVAQILRGCVSPTDVHAVLTTLPGREVQVAATIRTALSAGLLLTAKPTAPGT